jgi:hypothetical protein
MPLIYTHKDGGGLDRMRGRRGGRGGQGEKVDQDKDDAEVENKRKRWRKRSM